MTYCIGILAVTFLTFLVYLISKLADRATDTGVLSVLKLQYLVYGAIISFLFPRRFYVIYESFSGPALMFCIAWVGLYFGCSLELREHRRFTRPSFLFHILEPFVVFTIVAISGIVYSYTGDGSSELVGTAFIVAFFCAIGITDRLGHVSSEQIAPFHRILNDFPPVRNVPAVAAFSIAIIALSGNYRFSLFHFDITGIIPFFLIHILFGVAFGILVSMLVNGARSRDAEVVVLAGITALIGGMSDVFLLSPLIVGIVTGAFLINSTLKRLQIIEAVTQTHTFVENAFLFLIGSLVTMRVVPGEISVGTVLGGALAIIVIRGTIAWVLAYFRVTRTVDYNKGTSALWAGLTGQDIIAAAAAVEYHFRFPQTTSVFLLMIVITVMSRTIMSTCCLEKRIHSERSNHAERH